MPGPTLDSVTPANPDDLVQALADVLCSSGKARNHQTGQIMARIDASRLAEHLERVRFATMKKPSIGGSAPATGR